jgi:hypothetical protein
MDYKELLYRLAFEEHEIWIKHNKELLSLYNDSPRREDKVTISGEAYLNITKHFLERFEEWPEEYRREIIEAVYKMYNILINSNITNRWNISENDLLRSLCESEQNRRKSWLSYEEGATYADFSKESYLKYWPEEMATPFDKLSLGLQYWDLDEVRKRLDLIMSSAKINQEEIDMINNSLKELMDKRNPNPSTGGTYAMYDTFEEGVKPPQFSA